MPFCSQCGASVADAARFCPGCGAPQSSASQMPTTMATPRTPSASTPTSPIGRLDPSDSLFSARFAPGQTLAGRYRVVGLLGRGGMGEVYRADDLTLGQSVSLKFLPPRLIQDPAVLAQFHAEVRNARQVSHPNVCRVYDIGEFEGHPYLTMEYVDGEDLATLLRRIGRLPTAKANEVARQLCAGLAAAHDKGVLHRDLKPSNVMLDGHGRVRITDFGLAVRAEDGATGIAGTPAYMPPEQFEGKAVTIQSDLYSLGLILYEMYTGQRAFEAASIAEWQSRHTTSQAPSPTSVDPDVDPAVERAIVRCLEKDPSRRPASALQLAASLPGGDPLAAALAAGETPSPEMVAAAGGEGALSPRRAWMALAAFVLAVAAVIAVSPYSTDLGLSRFSKSGEVLAARAREIAVKYGYDADPVDAEGWFFRNYDPLLFKAKNTPSTEWRREMSGWFPPIGFNYRQSPRWMIPRNPGGTILTTDPPYEVSGMLGIGLDAEGRLIGLRGLAPQIDSLGAAAEPDWSALFRDAGLDLAAFEERSPRWVPPGPFDTRREWKGEAPWAPGVPLEVTAASFRRQPVYFEIHGPWSRADRMTPARRSRSDISQVVVGVLSIVVLIATLFFVRRNLRLGRGDHRGALRLGAFVAAISIAGWAMGTHHVGDAREINLFLQGMSQAVALGAILTMVYLALEPYVRRHMPELMIGWARVLEGRFRDPRVGRDLLVGCLFATLVSLSLHLVNGLPTWFSLPGQTTIPPSLDALEGGRMAAAFVMGQATFGLGTGLFMFAALFLLRVILRRPALAAVALAAFVFMMFLGGENPMLELPNAAVIAALVAFLAARYGLLALAVFWVVFLAFNSMPLPPSPGAPYFATSVVMLVALAAVAFYGFRVSLGSRPLFASIED